MITAKLVTRRNQPKTSTPTTKRQTKRACHPPQGTERVTYRATFNTINSTLAKHGMLLVTLKQCNATILTVNQPHITLLNSLIRSDLDKHLCLHKNLRDLDTQQHDFHDTRVVQTDEYRRNHITPDAGKNAPHPTYTTVHHLIDTSHTTAALASSINTPHHTDTVLAVYDR